MCGDYMATVVTNSSKRSRHPLYRYRMAYTLFPGILMDAEENQKGGVKKKRRGTGRKRNGRRIQHCLPLHVLCVQRCTLVLINSVTRPHQVNPKWAKPFQNHSSFENQLSLPAQSFLPSMPLSSLLSLYFVLLSFTPLTPQYIFPSFPLP